MINVFPILRLVSGKPAYLLLRHIIFQICKAVGKLQLSKQLSKVGQSYLDLASGHLLKESACLVIDSR